MHGTTALPPARLPDLVRPQPHRTPRVFLPQSHGDSAAHTPSHEIQTDSFGLRRKVAQQATELSVAAYFRVHATRSPNCPFLADTLESQLFQDQPVTRICDKFASKSPHRPPVHPPHKRSRSSASTANSDGHPSSSVPSIHSPHFEQMLQDAYRKYTQSFFSQAQLGVPTASPSESSATLPVTPTPQVSAFRLSIDPASEPEMMPASSFAAPEPPKRPDVHGFSALEVSGDFRVRVRRVQIN